MNLYRSKFSLFYRFDFFFDYSHKYPACVIRLNTENSILEDFHEEVSLASITSNEWITLTATNSFNENQVKIDVKKVHSPKVVVLVSCQIMSVLILNPL